MGFGGGRASGFVVVQRGGAVGVGADEARRGARWRGRSLVIGKSMLYKVRKNACAVGLDFELGRRAIRFFQKNWLRGAGAVLIWVGMKALCLLLFTCFCAASCDTLEGISPYLVNKNFEESNKKIDLHLAEGRINQEQATELKEKNKRVRANKMAQARMNLAAISSSLSGVTAQGSANSLHVSPLSSVPAVPLTINRSVGGLEPVLLRKKLGVTGDKIIVQRRSGSVYLFKLGVGALSVWRYEGRIIHVAGGYGFFGGVGTKIVLPNGETARVWSSERLH